MIFVPTPSKCDMCSAQLGNIMYDAKTRQGPWGCLCPTCFANHGVGLGTGRGQKYEAHDDGAFHLAKEQKT